jgi:group I intron endonuclease
MFYLIYKITNNINQKYYIGMHKTDNLNDGYMGSGKLIKQSINKYGIENFIKEILHVFDNEEDMKNKEKELVVINEMSYNLCDGGKGGFGYINKTNISKFKGKIHSEESKNKISDKMKGNKHWSGKKHSEESKLLIGKIMKEKLSGSSKTEEHKRKISESIKRKHREKNAGLV